MTRINSTRVGATAIFCLAAALLTPSSDAAAQSSNSASQHSLVGAWLIQVTLRDCATNAALGPPRDAIVSFHRGGTLSESAGSGAFAPGQRSPGHGSWAQASGHTYSQDMVALVLFDTEPNLPGTPTFDPTKPVSPGFFAGWQTISHTVGVTDADHFASSGTNAFYKTNGELYRTGCSTATAERF